MCVDANYLLTFNPIGLTNFLIRTREYLALGVSRTQRIPRSIIHTLRVCPGKRTVMVYQGSFTVKRLCMLPQEAPVITLFSHDFVVSIDQSVLRHLADSCCTTVSKRV